MHALVRTMFFKLHALDPAVEEAKLITTEDETQEGEIKLTVTTSQTVAEDALASAGVEAEAPKTPLTVTETAIVDKIPPDEPVVATQKPECQCNFLFPTPRIVF